MRAKTPATATAPMPAETPAAPASGGFVGTVPLPVGEGTTIVLRSDEVTAGPSQCLRSSVSILLPVIEGKGVHTSDRREAHIQPTRWETGQDPQCARGRPRAPRWWSARTRQPRRSSRGRRWAEGPRSACLLSVHGSSMTKKQVDSHQWSPWGSQPMESVGDGPGSSVCSWSSCSSAVVVGSGASVVRGPSQCLDLS